MEMLFCGVSRDTTWARQKGALCCKHASTLIAVNTVVSYIELSASLQTHSALAVFCAMKSTESTTYTTPLAS